MKVEFEDIDQIVNHRLKSKKAPGYNLITSEIAKNLPSIAFKILVKLYLSMPFEIVLQLKLIV